MRFLFGALLAAVVLSFSGPLAAQAKVVAILLPGAGGAVPEDFLVRNRKKFTAAGIDTVVTTSASKAASISKKEKAKGSTVALVGMSRGSLRLAEALAQGATASRVVFVSGNFIGVMKTLKSPKKLPPTLVVHHRQDRCKYTPPGAARRFDGWARGNVKIKWISTKGKRNNPCGPFGAHGFYRDDGPAVSAIIDFLK